MMPRAAGSSSRIGRLAATAPENDPEAQHGSDSQRTDQQGLAEHVTRQFQGVEVADHPDREQQHEPGQHRTDQHKPSRRATKVAAVRCWTKGRPSASATAKAANVAAATMAPAGMAKRSTRPVNPGM